MQRRTMLAGQHFNHPHARATGRWRRAGIRLAMVNIIEKIARTLMRHPHQGGTGAGIGKLVKAGRAILPDDGLALGIMTGDDAAQRISAGAALVQLYTGLVYAGPALVGDCVNAIRKARS